MSSYFSPCREHEFDPVVEDLDPDIDTGPDPDKNERSDTVHQSNSSLSRSTPVFLAVAPAPRQSDGGVSFSATTLFQSNDEFPFSANPTTRTPDLATLWPVVAQAQINLMNTSPIYSGLFALPKISLLL